MQDLSTVPVETSAFSAISLILTTDFSRLNFNTTHQCNACISSFKSQPSNLVKITFKRRLKVVDVPEFPLFIPIIEPIYRSEC
jgi:hypothetical protein